MMKVKLSEKYPNDYLSLMCGVTFTKDGEPKLVDENVNEVKIMLEQGYLEVVETEAEMKQEIITDKPDSTKTIKEVVTPQNSDQLKEVLKKEGENDGGSTAQDSF